MDEQMYKWMMEARMEAGMDGWMLGWMDAWMDGWINGTSIIILVQVNSFGIVLDSSHSA